MRSIFLGIATAAGCVALFYFLTGRPSIAYSAIPVGFVAVVVSQIVKRLPISTWDKEASAAGASLFALKALLFFSLAAWVAHHQIPRMIAPTLAGYVVEEDQATRVPLIRFETSEGRAIVMADDRRWKQDDPRPAVDTKVNALETSPGTFAISTRSEASVFWGLFLFAAELACTMGAFALIAFRRYAHLVRAE